ncbi:hypothetical protein [Streptomyces sp. NPDC021356]|uniref:hypothetical protein n=1 Tax=Streptomyces sp. NPDC021356 TaxID=3154900 RepID=UPI0033C2D42D
MPNNVIGSGSTTPGQNWQPTPGGQGIYIDVNTSQAQFNPAFGTPAYTISLGGQGTMWDSSGSSAVYNPTLTGFRVYLRDMDRSNPTVTVAQAQQHGFHINWIGVQTF